MLTKPRPRKLRGLVYLGGGSLNGIPARDLSVADLERLAAQPYIGRRFSADAAELEALLAAGPLYRIPSKPSNDATAPLRSN